MKVSEVDVIKIPELPELTALPAGGGDVPIYNGADNILYRIKAALLGGGNETALKWVVDTTYAADKVVEFGLKLWLSLAAGNTGNTPIEGVWWTEVSKSTANGFGYYAPGVYTVDPSMVIRSGGLFWLDNTTVTFPFYSTDFEAEFAQNKWVQLTGSGAGGGFVWNVVHIDSAVTTSFNAVKNTHYIVNCSTAPVTAILPNAVAGNVDDFSFTLAVDTHKLTVTTVGGTQLIGQHTSFIIPTIGGGGILKADNDHYGIITDTRQLTNIVTITGNRDFSTDGFENNIIYQIHPNGGEITISLPTAYVLDDDIVIKSRFEQIGEGRVSIGAATGTIGGESTIILNANGQGIDIIWAGVNYTTANDTRVKSLTASFTSYAVSEFSTITDPLRSAFFTQRVTTIEDPRFDKVTAVEGSAVITANPTDPWQLVTSSISDEGVLIGEIAEGAVSVLANIRRSGLNVNVYFTYSKRTAAGVETLIASSSVVPVTSDIYIQYGASAIHEMFTMDATDRFVARFYARKATTGVNPTLYYTSEGANPTRSTVEVAAGTIAHNTLAGRGGANAHPATAISIDSSGFNGNLTPADNTVQKVAQKFDNYVGGGTVTDYENIFFEVATPDKAYITRAFNWKISSATEYGGTSMIKKSAGAAYTIGATVTAGDYLTVTNTTINARLVAIIQPA